MTMPFWIGILFSSGFGLGETAKPAPLETLSGQRLVLEHYVDRPATAVVFLSPRCPLTLQQIDKINTIHGKYRQSGVLFVGISANDAVAGDELRTFAQRRGVIFPLYRDPTSTVAKQFAASNTPEVFLLDRSGKLVFHGGLANQSGQDLLREAIASTLTRRSVAKPDAPVTGIPIDQPGTPVKIDDRYGSIAFSSELIFETIPDSVVYHCSTIAETAAGDLLALWYGGTYESADDQSLFLARRPKGSRAWSKPEVLMFNPLQPPGNAVIFRDGAGRMRIVWGRMEKPRPIDRGSGWGQCRLFSRVSGDDGRTWSSDQPIAKLVGVPRNPPIRLKDGTWLLGLEGRSTDGKQKGSYFLTSRDDAATWRRDGFIASGSQPALAERPDGSILAMLRHMPRIQLSESSDAGATWSIAKPSELKNPDAGISMTKLANGHLVLVFNNSSFSRTPLSVVRSLDDGRTWERPLDLENSPGEYSYPCVIQTADGKIHTTYTCRRYTIKHVEFNEDWLFRFERPD